VVVVGCLSDHRDAVDALGRERQLRADALGLGAAGALDLQRRLVQRRRSGVRENYRFRWTIPGEIGGALQSRDYPLTWQ
jgi:hypothetical protein